MATNPCVISLTVKLVISLTTVTSSPLTDKLVLRPIDDQVRNAVDELDLRDKTKVALLEQYINVGNYSNDFIELLNTYNTFKDLPIRFNDDEIRLLTTSNTEDSINDKILAQLNYYRKIQEIQCADYLILQYMLYGTERNTEEIAKHVYIMIAMAYKGKSVVFKWLWELHITIWSPTEDDAVQPLNMIVQNLENFRKPLADLIEMCVGHTYITVIDNDQQNPDRTVSRPRLLRNFVKWFNLKYKHNKPALEESSNRPKLVVNIEEFYKSNHEKYELYNKNTPALPLSVNHLSLRYVWHQTSFLIKPIPRVTIDWDSIEHLYIFDRQKAYDQFEVTHDWRKEPFKYIQFQQSFIDIIRVKLYCYIWVKLSMYKPTGYYFKSLIFDVLKFSYIEDKTLNKVIIMYDDKPNQEQIEEVMKIILHEVNTILTNLIRSTNQTELADISDMDKPSLIHFEVELNKQFEAFGRQFNGRLNGLTLDLLSFFIDGSKNTHLAVFPEN
ncbi:uncharacterized protein LOC126847530 [Adelges cooleyi]|uniref:uncharacterized protein LOC126847530 n=1 Tax=Adelges cooleyi TaxID=133065 RepID=UPI00217F90C7|nr:uncharacterized protein LOC126847530 [Adelges cooleyi]